MSGLWIFICVREKNFINLENFEKENGYLSASSSRDRRESRKEIERHAGRLSRMQIKGKCDLTTFSLPTRQSAVSLSKISRLRIGRRSSRNSDEPRLPPTFSVAIDNSP